MGMDYICDISKIGHVVSLADSMGYLTFSCFPNQLIDEMGVAFCVFREGKGVQYTKRGQVAWNVRRGRSVCVETGEGERG